MSLRSNTLHKLRRKHPEEGCLTPYTVRLKESLHFEKVSQINEVQEMFIHVSFDSYGSLLSNEMRKKSDDVSCL